MKLIYSVFTEQLLNKRFQLTEFSSHINILKTIKYTLNLISFILVSNKHSGMCFFFFFGGFGLIF